MAQPFEPDDLEGQSVSWYEAALREVPEYDPSLDTRALAYATPQAVGKDTPRQRKSVWLYLLAYTAEITGSIIEIIGGVVVWIGKMTKEWGISMRV